MHLFRLVIVFLFAILMSSILIATGMQRLMVFFIVITFYLAAAVAPSIYITYFSTSLKRIDRFVKSNRRKPLFGYPYQIAYGNDEQIQQALQKILARHRQPELQQTYKALLAITQDQPGVARQYAEQIQRESLRTYYLAHAAANSGDYDHATELLEQLKEPWMRSAIRALIAFETNDPQFDRLAEDSIAAARGVQKYTLFHSFRRLKESGPKQI